MEKKIDRRILMTKQLLRNALIDLLNEKDIYRISIRELCDRANVNRSTFYKYYGSQFDLMSEMENEAFIAISSKIDTSDVQKCVTSILVYLEQNIEFSRLLLNSTADHTFLQKLFSESSVKDTIMKALLETFTEPILEYMYQFIVSGCCQMVRTWVNKDVREPVAIIVELFCRLFPTNTKMIPEF